MDNFERKELLAHSREKRRESREESKWRDEGETKKKKRAE